ncbi:MAG: chemotaxis protein CheD [Bryobacteraceae bacterium]
MIVGASDCKLSGDLEACLIAYALGSCVAVALHDPETRLAGLLHFLLPEAAISPERAERNPYTFGDAGIARLLEKICAMGANRKRLTATIAGGARLVEASDIGALNSIAARQALRCAGIAIASENLGGTTARTLSLEVATGRAAIR